MVRKTKTSSLRRVSLQTLVRILAITFFVAAGVFAGGSLLLFTLGGVMMAITTAVAYHRTGDLVWKELMCVLLLFVAAIPIALVWPLVIVKDWMAFWTFWDPAHLLIIGGLMAGMVMTLPLVQKDKNIQARVFLKAMLWGGILYLAIILTLPFMPRAGQEIARFWGAGVTAIVMVGILLEIRRSNKIFAFATLAMIFSLLLIVLGIEGRALVPTVPLWLIMLSLLVPAGIVDLTFRFPAWVRGALTGFTWAAILYTFAACFLPAGLHYGMGDALAAIISGTVGGSLATILTRLS